MSAGYNSCRTEAVMKEREARGSRTHMSCFPVGVDMYVRKGV